MTETTELVVFVASPSDVQDERAAVRAVAERIQNALGLRIDLRIRTVGWEQVPPGYGRPQGQINPLIDTCDIFIGILNARWGTESGTHSSGFIEEFELAVARFEAGGRPEISMFFKKVPQSQRDDPGPQLQQVLSFRNRIQSEHVLLYSDFTDTADFERQVMDLLLSRVGEIVSKSPVGPDSPSDAAVAESVNVQADASSDPGSTVDSTTSLNKAQSQLVDLLDIYSALIRRNPNEAPLDNDRLLLFALTVSRGPFLPTHEANRLFNRRSQIALVIGEVEHWLRSMAVNWLQIRENRTVPGWAVIGADAFPQSVGALLDDIEASVASGALEFMTSMGYRPSELWSAKPANPDGRVIERWKILLANPSTSDAATAHLALLAKPTDRPLIGAVSESLTDNSIHATMQIIEHAISGNFDDLVESTVSSLYPQRWQVEKLAEVIPVLNKSNLLKLMTSGDSSSILKIKHAAARQVADRHEIDAQTVSAVLGGQDEEVARIVIDAIWIWQADGPSKAFGAAVESLGGTSGDEAWRRSWPSVAPRVLAATRPSGRLEKLQQIDADSWEALRYQEGIDGVTAARTILGFDKDRWAATLSAPIRSALEEKDLIPFTYANHVEAALRYLSQFPSLTADDLDLIRSRLGDTQWTIQIRAAEALSRVGAAADAQLILDAAVTTDNSLNRSDLLGAALAIGGVETVEAAVGIADGSTAATIVPHLARLDQSVLTPLLNHSVASIRIAAADALSRQLSPERLQAILNDYTTRGQYYYNVVVALDAILYGPQPVSVNKSGIN